MWAPLCKVLSRPWLDITKKILESLYFIVSLLSSYKKIYIKFVASFDARYHQRSYSYKESPAFEQQLPLGILV